MKSCIFRLLSISIALTMLITLIQFSVSAVLSDVIIGEEPISTLLSLEELQNAHLNEGDIPEVLITNNAVTDAFVHRVRIAEDEHSLVFQKKDGICQKFVFSEPIQYRLENGKLKDKKTKTVLIGNDFVTTDTDVTVKIPKSLNNGIKIAYNKLNLKIKPIGLMNKNKTYYSSVGSSYLYTDTFDSFSDIMYSPTFTGVKCDIILEKYNNKNTFSFEIHTNGYHLEKNDTTNSVSVVDDAGNPIVYFNSIFSYDSAGNISFGDISFQEQNAKNKYILTITVDESFLTDPDTVYPVIIDPTTTATMTNRSDLEYLCLYSNGTSQSSSSSSTANMLVGTSANGVIGRVLYRFGKVPAKNLIKAELIQCARNTGSYDIMHAYAYQGNPWDSSSNYSNITFSHSADPVMTTQFGNDYGTASKYMTMDVTAFVNLCKSSPQNYSLEKGILLKNLSGELSPEYTATDSSVAISTTSTTVSPALACFSPYLLYTYEPFRIMLDAGHKTSSDTSTFHEGNRMWQLHLYLKNQLQSLGYYVGVTRADPQNDVDVEIRGSMAAGHDMFISLHSNTDDDTSINRVVVIRDIYDKNQATIFANQIGNAVRDVMNSRGLNITSVQVWERELLNKDDTIYYDEHGNMLNYYGVLRKAAQTDCPLYYIVEHSFHSNNLTASWLMSDSNLFALAVAEAVAIDSYLNP